MAILDTHKSVKRLVEKNFTEEQAETIVLVIQESLEQPKGLHKAEAVFLIFIIVVLFVMFCSVGFKK